MKRIQQPTDNSCTSACLAMLTGLPLAQVMSEFHTDFRKGNTNAYRYLDFKGIEYVQHPDLYTIGGDCDGWAYLLSVPSLNKFSEMHNIVVYTDQGNLHILDPQQGAEGMKFYESVSKDYVGVGYHLNGFTPELKIYVGGELNVQ